VGKKLDDLAWTLVVCLVFVLAVEAGAILAFLFTK
jgi:hypothetical protein